MDPLGGYGLWIRFGARASGVFGVAISGIFGRQCRVHTRLCRATTIVRRGRDGQRVTAASGDVESISEPGRICEPLSPALSDVRKRFAP
jgi:hypothetical protein